ncbi:hypothetical protein [Luteibacter yeojuensis]|uniref:Uncharacterized protein n=1 Tax=Luteibacter yeojuensis TaxID=345309 RepID=A0A0F3KU23_9GAMM|nr:hypothetical protein [Luteibacter yeojuensis]KJV34765.1 hypothetical protein VI08_09250 [Luteibacter yeojuensis]
MTKQQRDSQSDRWTCPDRLTVQPSGPVDCAGALPPNDSTLWGELSALVSALRKDDFSEASFRAFRMHRLARRVGCSRTADAGEELEIALMCCEACHAMPVQRALLGLISATALEGALARQGSI